MLNAIITKNNGTYSITVRNGQKFVESTSYPYIPLRVAKAAAVQRLAKMGNKGNVTWAEGNGAWVATAR